MVVLYRPLSVDRVVWVALFTELERVVVPVRSIARPVLESYALPEVSMMRVLGAVELVLLLTPELLLPDNAVRVLPLDDLPESLAVSEVVLLAELVR